MSTTLYYFTGTGNSLKVAKDLAKELKDAELIQINRNNIKEDNKNTAENIGIIFPVYYFGMPILVKEFVETLVINKDTYIFAIATCGGTIGIAIKQLEDILDGKGNKLSAGFKIIMPDNYQLLYSPPSYDKQQKLFKIQEKRVSEIASKINNNEVFKFKESGNYLIKVISRPLHSSFKPHNRDKNFWTDENCNGCSICARLCAANNIEMIKNKPTWHHKCELCLACMQWCPQKSIQYKKSTINRERYNNPNIKLQELYQKKRINNN